MRSAFFAAAVASGIGLLGLGPAPGIRAQQPPPAPAGAAVPQPAPPGARGRGPQGPPKPPTVTEPEGYVVTSELQKLRVEVVARDLETPWGIGFLPDGRLLITERPGRLRIVEKGKLSAPVTGLPKVEQVQDGGMFDVEVHPQYAKNGWIYLSYAEPGPDNTSLTERAPNNTGMTAIVRGKINKNNEWVEQQYIFHATPDFYTATHIHYGSRFLFDKQGHLFFSLGEHGKPEDAQDLSKPTGKVHRVNDDGSIPNDNPFVKRDGAVKSIWTYGHRNPQGLAFDPATGKLWETEHGPNGGDELNLLQAGHNYGWAVVSNGTQPGITKTEQEGMDSPVVFWTPTMAPGGIAFATGNRYPKWKDQLFVTGLGGQVLRRITIDKDKVTHQEVVFDNLGRVRDIIQGPDGFFYVATALPGQRLSDTTVGFVLRNRQSPDRRRCERGSRAHVDRPRDPARHARPCLRPEAAGAGPRCLCLTPQ
jgi:glucose/arabinose dehydrogenase